MRLFKKKRDNYLIIFEVDKSAVPQLAGDAPVRFTIPEDVKRDITEHFRNVQNNIPVDPKIFHLPPGVSVRIEKL